MRTLFASVSVLMVAAAPLLLAGCETSSCTTDEGEDAVCADSLTLYQDHQYDAALSADYVDGAQVSVEGIYGDILVTVGEPGVVLARFQPFNYRSNKKDDEAFTEIQENLEFDVSADADGNIVVSAVRQDATNGLGAHITVELPPEFNGPLSVVNDADGVINSGAVDVSFVGDSTELSVINEGLENCNILRGDDDEPAAETLLTTTSVECGGDITLRGVNDDVIVQNNADFPRNVRVELNSVSATANGGSLIGNDTTFELIMPAGADFDVQARGEDGATVEAGDLPAACEASTETDTALDITCGAGGPVYEVTTSDADLDDDEDAFIRVLVE